MRTIDKLNIKNSIVRLDVFKTKLNYKKLIKQINNRYEIFK